MFLSWHTVYHDEAHSDKVFLAIFRKQRIFLWKEGRELICFSSSYEEQLINTQEMRCFRAISSFLEKQRHGLISREKISPWKTKEK